MDASQEHRRCCGAPSNRNRRAAPHRPVHAAEERPFGADVEAVRVRENLSSLVPGWPSEDSRDASSTFDRDDPRARIRRSDCAAAERTALQVHDVTS